jgi:regulator of extracellular matrix RemA (YlzA/DUF370 family)
VTDDVERPMMGFLMDIGEGNSLAVNQILAVIQANTSPGKRLRAQAKRLARLVDATGGKPTKSLVVTCSNHLILSNQEPEELTRRLNEFLDSAES